MLLSLTGPSGVGKTTIARQLLSHSSGGFHMVKSFTTRPRRGSDIPGEYEYASPDWFGQMVKWEKFLWRVEHGGNSYGTTLSSIVQAVFQNGRNAVGIMILVPDVIPRLRGYLTSLGRVHEHIPVFIEPPEDKVLLSRMLRRGDGYLTAHARLVESAEWKRAAFESTLPYHFLRNDGSVGETVQAILSLLKNAEAPL